MPDQPAVVDVVVETSPFDTGAKEAIAYPFDYSSLLLPSWQRRLIDVPIPKPIVKPSADVDVALNHLSTVWGMVVMGIGFIVVGVGCIPYSPGIPMTGDELVLRRVRGRSYLKGMSFYKLRYHLRRLTQLLVVPYYKNGNRGEEHERQVEAEAQHQRNQNIAWEQCGAPGIYECFHGSSAPVTVDEATYSRFDKAGAFTWWKRIQK